MLSHPTDPPERPSAGYCSWHQGRANDVALIVVHEQGSGVGGGEYACLPCAQPLARHWTTSPAAKKAITALEERSASTVTQETDRG